MSDVSPAERSASLEIGGSAGPVLRADALAPDLLRLRVAPRGLWAEDASWAVSQASRARRDGDATVSREAGTATLRTTALALAVDTATLATRLTTPQGETILADAPGRAPTFHEAGFSLRKAMPRAERYFALGDKTGPLDRRGHRFVNWATDQYVTATADPLYKAIPFVLAAGGPGGCWGLLADNTFRLSFDFGASEADVLAIDAADGPFDLYLVVGDTVDDVVRRYADLTGHPPMPPRWAFGYHQCRYSYMSADEVRAVAARLRRDRFPADVIWLDIGFQDRNRPFTTNPATYPDLPGLAAQLRRDGFATVVITDLHIAAAPGENYLPCDSGMAADAFLRGPDGEPYVGEVWPGPAHFPDFARADVRRWWGDLYRGFVEAGIAGFWIDMNEPSVFDGPGKTVPLDVVHRIETPGFAPRAATEAEMHNVTGLLNSQATFEGLQRLRPDERPFVMTRSTYAGGQKWAVTWTGDNDAAWSHIGLGVRQTLNLGLSGFPFTAVDVGGFMGEPGADLLTRWFQVQAFMPLFRDHTAEGTPPQEPWVHGPEHEAIRRRFVEERYRLMPTIYALADEAHRTGAPMVRPAFFADSALLDEDAGDPATFMLGDALLVAVPPDDSGEIDFTVRLPRGRWYDYWTDAAVDGDAEKPRARERRRIDRLPVFVRSGAILVRQVLVQSLSEPPEGPLELDLWPGDEGVATIYDDDGRSTAYLRGVFLRQEVRSEPCGDGLALRFGAREGTYAPPWREMRVTIHDWAGATIRLVGADGEAVAGQIDQARRTGSVLMAAPLVASRFQLVP